MKKQHKCKLSWPDWLKTAELEKFIEDEREQASFTKLPFYYGETGKLILDNFSDDHPESQKIRSLWSDLVSVRMDKVVLGADFIRGLAENGNEDLLNSIDLVNVGPIDILSSKPYITASMDQFRSFYNSSQLASAGDSNVLGGDDDDDDDDDDGTGRSGRRGRRRFRRNRGGAANDDNDD